MRRVAGTLHCSMKGLALLAGLNIGLLPAKAAAETALQYNPYTKRFELAPEGAVPEYNPYTHRRELATPDAVPQYNPYTKKFELAPPNAVPEYNPRTHKRELVPPDSSR